MATSYHAAPTVRRIAQAEPLRRLCTTYAAPPMTARPSTISRSFFTGVLPLAGGAPQVPRRSHHPRSRTGGDAGRTYPAHVAGASYDVVVLAGGASRRFRGTVPDKLALTRDGASLLETVLAGARAATAGRVVAVGPDPGASDPAAAGVTWTREDPPGGGPLAAIAAALPAVTAEVVVLLAGDAPQGPAAAAALVAALLDAGDRADAAVLVDSDGRRATLCAAMRTDVARLRMRQIGAPQGRPLRTLYDGITVLEVPDAWRAADDVDTPEDAVRLGWK